MLLLILFYIIGITFIGLSIYLRFWRGKRKFNRRNMAGMETFNSYGKAMATNWLENFAQFIYIFLMSVGILLLLAAVFGAHDIMRVNHF